MRIVLGLLGSVGALTIYACAPPSVTGSAYDGTSDEPSTSEDDLEDGADDAPSEASPDEGDDPAPNDPKPEEAAGACAAEKDRLACTQCCDALSPGAKRAFERQEEICFCQAPGTCAAECGDTFCAGRITEPRSACSDCLVANGAACTKSATAICKQDASCAPVVTCYASSKCTAKP